MNPNNAVARMNYAQLLAGLGRIEDALREGQRSRELDPLSLPFHTAYASVLIGAGRYDEAIAVCQEALRMNAGFFWAHHHLWRAYARKGMFEEALASARTALSGQGDAELVDALDRGRRQAGYAGAMRAAADTLAARARTRYVMAFSVALLYANAGEKKAALDWLERAYQQHGALLEYIRISPEFEDLRPDPRYPGSAAPPEPRRRSSGRTRPVIIRRSARGDAHRPSRCQRARRRHTSSCCRIRSSRLACAGCPARLRISPGSC